LGKWYKINKNFFDVIDTENKAYWMGFIWCDGYCIKRIRDKGKIEYSFKLSLQESDIGHLEKLKKDINSDYDIKIYYLPKNAFRTDQKECRFLVGNQYFGKLLQEKYGLIPHRSDPSKVCNEIPKIFYKDFIRGILDADGSLSKYVIHKTHNKYSVSFSTYQNLIRWILKILKEENIIEIEDRKLGRRNKEGDGECRSVSFTGRNQSLRVLDYLYKNSNVYLDRKYEKYLKIRKEINNEL